MISFGLEIILGDDLFFLPVYEHRLAPRLLLRAFDSVLEARGLRCGARAAFSTLASRNLAWSTRFSEEAKRFLRAHLSPLDFSEVFLARTRQEVLPGHVESCTTKERRLGTAFKI